MKIFVFLSDINIHINIKAGGSGGPRVHWLPELKKKCKNIPFQKFENSNKLLYFYLGNPLEKEFRILHKTCNIKSELNHNRGLEKR